MNSPKHDKFDERATNAAKARAAMLERFRARPGPDDPAVQEKMAAQKAINDAREIRNAERKVAREAEAARLAAEQAALAAEAEAKAAEELALQAQAAERATELAARQKAARDARYAARNARRR